MGLDTVSDVTTTEGLVLQLILAIGFHPDELRNLLATYNEGILENLSAMENAISHQSGA